jgi:hypothetical protein
VLVGLEIVVKLDNAVMSTLLEDGELLHDSSLLLLFVIQAVLVESFDSDKLLGQLVTRKVDFAESSSSKNTTYSVEFTGAWVDGFVFLEVQLDLLFEFLDVRVILFQLLCACVFRLVR